MIIKLRLTFFLTKDFLVLFRSLYKKKESKQKLIFFRVDSTDFSKTVRYFREVSILATG